MTAHVFLALSSPSENREAEFHAWYEGHHVADVVRFCSGFVSGQRFYAQSGDPHPDRWPSLALYGLESDDLEALHRSVSDSVRNFTPSRGVFAPDHAAWVYSAQAGDSAALNAWLDEPVGEVIQLDFADDPEVLSAAPASSPLLFRAADQRSGEWPVRAYLRLSCPRGATTVGDAAGVTTWRYHRKGQRFLAPQGG